MSLFDVLLDTTWSSYFVPADEIQTSALSLFQNISKAPAAEIAEDLHHLSHEFRDYLLSQDSSVAYDFDKESEKRGSLQACVITQLEPHTPPVNSRSPGLLLEIRFQKAVARVVILHTSTTGLDGGGNVCRPSLVLFKAPASYVKQIISWLSLKFDVCLAKSLRLPSELIVKSCSQYLNDLSHTWTFGQDDGNAALEQATLKQVVGNLKLTISVSETARAQTSGKLKTIDLEIPCESVYSILKKMREGNLSGGEGSTSTSFLDELREAVRLRTGLRLPLTAEYTARAGQTEDSSFLESPLKVSRVSCAGFAVGIDGRLKFAKQSVENADVIGYDGSLVSNANWNLLKVIKGEAERQAGDQGKAG